MVLARPDKRETWPYHCSFISLRWSGGLRVVQMLAGSWHRLPRWLHGLCMRCVVSYDSTSFPWLVVFFGALLLGSIHNHTSIHSIFQKKMESLKHPVLTTSQACIKFTPHKIFKAYLWCLLISLFDLLCHSLDEFLLLGALLVFQTKCLVLKQSWITLLQIKCLVLKQSWITLLQTKYLVLKQSWITLP